RGGPGRRAPPRGWGGGRRRTPLGPRPPPPGGGPGAGRGPTRGGREPVERVGGTAPPPHHRGQARQPQPRDRVVDEPGRQPVDADRRILVVRRGLRFRAFGDEDAAHASAVAQLVERGGRFVDALAAADDDDG